jgi:4-amino-4-deoxy-L-arabinose transferase-like glycosyltransferase
VFPSFVAVSRDNGVDPLLILLMLAACGAGLAAIDSGRLRRLVWCAVLVGLAFNTKSSAALLCIPGIAVGYLVCAPGSWRRRVGQLVVAGVVFVVVAASWSAVVDLTPTSARPFVGSTSANTEAQLIFGYNGLGRVGGQQGGPGSTKLDRAAAQPPLVRPGVNVAESAIEKRYFAAHPGILNVKPAKPPVPAARHGRVRATLPVAFASTTLSPVRIFGVGLGDQAGWDVPLAALGLVALGLVVRRRSDRRARLLLVLVGSILLNGSSDA